MSTLTRADVMADPCLKGLPLRIELNKPSKSWGEMHMKAGLCREAGADEAWNVALDGERRVIRA